MQTQYIQIGTTAARDPETGEFMPSVPMYAVLTPELETSSVRATKDVAKLFAEKMRRYIRGGALTLPENED